MKSKCGMKKINQMKYKKKLNMIKIKFLHLRIYNKCNKNKKIKKMRMNIRKRKKKINFMKNLKTKF